VSWPAIAVHWRFAYLFPMSAITIRDPIWNTISIDETARAIIDTAAFQRLRYIKQLGHAHLVYPGATHTRFDHAVGVYHLTRRALTVLAGRAGLEHVSDGDCRIIPFAALLHDVGHYPFSHALEELEASRIPAHHEALVGEFLRSDEIATVLARVATDADVRIEELIRGRSKNPLQGLVSGSLDLDKIEYLNRDARFCGVPYGDVDVDRLLHGLLVLEDPETGALQVGVHEKGVAALESLLFAKYQMFRNVYWHHAVRAATVLYKRVVSSALENGLVAPHELVGATDEGLMHLLETRAVARNDDRVRDGVAALRSRRLPKRAAEMPAGELGDGAHAEWLESDSDLKRRIEQRIAAELHIDGDDVFLDFPEKPAMFGLDMLVQRRSGEVLRLGPGGQAGLIGLPGISDELYRSARILRLYVAGARVTVDSAALARLAGMSAEGAEAALDDSASLVT
jgi:HD superfamily phosphohydrolase